jgi:serine/threonine protein kinase
VQKFRSEIMTHAYLSHRNVLPLMGVLMDPADPTSLFIFTEWMAGGTLERYIETDQYSNNFGPECNRLVSFTYVTDDVVNV